MKSQSKYKEIQKILPAILYVLKFIAVFCVCYYGTLAVIGLAAPGKLYSPFIAKYLDYVSWLKMSMIHTTGIILSFCGISTQTELEFLIRFKGGRGVYIAMDCVGYGVYSFWIAFVIANGESFFKKIIWIIIGLLAIWLINVTRITLFLLAINRGWGMPLGIDHHTWFTIAAYVMIFILIIFYDKSSKNKILKLQKK